MIQGQNKNNNEQSYREIFLDSSSSLKDFSLDRRKYLRKYIMSEDVEEKDNQSIVMGKVVETLLLEPELFDSRFSLSACANPPTAMMLEFVEALYRNTIEATDEDGNITKTFEERSKAAYLASGYKIAYEAVLKKFDGSDAEIFYNEILSVRANRQIVVTANDVMNAEKIVEELKTNSITSGIVNLVNNVRYTVMNQLQVEGFEIDGHKFKSMIDKVIVDHKEKTIQLYDLKCVWAVESFYSEYYLYRRSYIQAYLYKKAVEHLRNITEEYSGYKVLEPMFIVCDSTNYYSPLIYFLHWKDVVDAYEGFEHNGRKYPGVKEIIEDLKFALDNNTWNISRKNSLANGIINIKGI